MDDRRDSTRDVDRERHADHADRDDERPDREERGDGRSDREERGGWRPDSEGPDGTASDREEPDADGSSVEGVLGARPDDAPRPDLEPESPSAENAAFVVLGVLFAFFVIYRTIAVLPT